MNLSDEELMLLEQLTYLDEDMLKGAGFSGEKLVPVTVNGGHVGFISSVVDNGNGTYTIQTIEGNSGDSTCSHEYTFSQKKPLSSEWVGIIEMDREEKISCKDNINGSTVPNNYDED